MEAPWSFEVRHWWTLISTQEKELSLSHGHKMPSLTFCLAPPFAQILWLPPTWPPASCNGHIRHVAPHNHTRHALGVVTEELDSERTDWLQARCPKAIVFPKRICFKMLQKTKDFSRKQWLLMSRQSPPGTLEAFFSFSVRIKFKKVFPASYKGGAQLQLAV